MYSGIVFGKFAVVSVEKLPDMIRYAVVFSKELQKDLNIGASVAIDGVCQTVVSIEGERVFFEAIQETLEKTTLDELDVGRQVNVERSIRFGDEVGGHLLAGHVWGTGTIYQVEEYENHKVFTIACNPDWMRYFFPKGFIAIDGASLTVVAVDDEGFFSLHLIPETLKFTTLGEKKVGDRVNIELDMQTQIIVDTLEQFKGKR